MSGAGPAVAAARLWLVLDQLVAPTDADLRTASLELARALLRQLPARCEVAAIVPSGAADVEVEGVADVYRAKLPRRELAAAWQMGLVGDVKGGMIHSPTLLAPLVKHRRGADQTVVTLWELAAWDHPESVPRAAALWQKAMLKRAERYADAVVVPTHAHAERVAALSKLGARLRVIPGSAPAGFAVPGDAVGRRRTLAAPEGSVVVADGTDAAASLAAIGAARLDLPVVVLDAPDEGAVVELAAAAGVGRGRLHVFGALDAFDRAAVLDGALAVVSADPGFAFPWRLVEALVLGVPVVAVRSAVHAEVLGDGAALATDADELAAALEHALSGREAHRRLAVLAADRGRSFSWDDAADRVWALHAEL